MFRTNTLQQKYNEPMDTAIDFVERGWSVFPCHAVLTNSGDCTCRNERCVLPGEHPIVEDGLEFSTANIETVRLIWNKWPYADVAVRTGSISNLMVLDVDARHGGLDSLRVLIEAHGPLPETYTVSTPTGGLHYYFEQPTMPENHSAAMSLGQGLLVWGEKGFVVTPSNTRRDRKSYRAIIEDPAAAMPQWMADRIMKSAAKKI